MLGTQDRVRAVTELEPNVEIEYGLILPRPAGAQEWFAKNVAALDGIQERDYDPDGRAHGFVAGGPSRVERWRLKRVVSE